MVITINLSFIDFRGDGISVEDKISAIKEWPITNVRDIGSSIQSATKKTHIFSIAPLSFNDVNEDLIEKIPMRNELTNSEVFKNGLSAIDCQKGYTLLVIQYKT